MNTSGSIARSQERGQQFRCELTSGRLAVVQHVSRVVFVCEEIASDVAAELELDLVSSVAVADLRDSEQQFRCLGNDIGRIGLSSPGNENRELDILVSLSLALIGFRWSPIGRFWFTVLSEYGWGQPCNITLPSCPQLVRRCRAVPRAASTAGDSRITLIRPDARLGETAADSRCVAVATFSVSFSQ